MSRSVPNETLRRRIETGIALAAPLLDLALAVIDRISRVLGPQDDDRAPVTPRTAAGLAARTDRISRRPPAQSAPPPP